MVLGRVLVTASSWMTRKVISTTVAHKATKEIMKILSVLIDAYTHGKLRRRVLKRIAKTLVHKFVEAQTEDILKLGLSILQSRAKGTTPKMKISDILDAFGGGSGAAAIKDEPRSRQIVKQRDHVRRRDGRARASESGHARRRKSSRHDSAYFDTTRAQSPYRANSRTRGSARRTYSSEEDGYFPSKGRWRGSNRDEDWEECRSVSSRDWTVIDVSDDRVTSRLRSLPW